MTDQEMRIKIAESVGYKELFMDNGKSMVQQRWESPYDEFCYVAERLPDYLADLNACAQFQDELKRLGVFSSYLSNLALVCGFNAQGDEAWFNLHAGLEAVYSATARQRCIAFLKTKGIIP